MNLDNIKKMSILFWIGIISICFTIIFSAIKISLAFFEDYNKRTIISLLVSSLIILLVKFKIYIPRIIKLKKLKENIYNKDTSIFKRIYIINKVFVIIYSITLISDIMNMNFENYEFNYKTFIKLLPLVMTSITLIIDFSNLIYSKQLKDHFKTISN